MSNHIERGSQWLRLFHDKKIEFVGEIQVGEAELDNLCSAIHRRLDQPNGEEFLSLLTVVVVNLAYYSPEGFREHVLSKIVGQPAPALFDSLIGPAVEQVLRKHFAIEPRTGPYRYVTPIKQQAGIPASIEQRFVSQFCALLRQHGFDFSNDAYQRFCRQVSAPTLDDFLRSDTGRHFCRDLARVLRNRCDGLFDAQAFPDQPRFRALVEKAWPSLRADTPAIVRRLPHPKLILDLNRKRLAVEFSERGLNGGYYWDDGVRVSKRLVYVEAKDFSQGLRGQIHQPDGSTEDWELTIWQPADCPWAAFRGSDGLYIGQKEKLSPGCYLLVVPEEISLPTAQDFDEYGWLELPIRNDQSFVIFAGELPAGFEIPEIGLAVESDAGACPTLEFLPGRALPLTHNVFAGRLPEVRISNRGQAFAQRFFVLMNNTPVSPANDKLHCAPPAPSQGEIRIEPRGRTPRGFVPQALRYTLLLPEVRIETPSGLMHPGEDAFVEFHPPQNFQVHWEDESIERIGPGRWRVPPEVEFIEGKAIYQSRIAFPVYGAIHRFKISSEAIKGRVLWRESFESKPEIKLHFSRQEIGQAVELGLLHHSNLAPSLRLAHVVPNNTTLAISTEEIRDALTDSPLTAAALAVRLPTRRKNEPRLFASEIVYVNERKLVEELRRGEDETLLAILPEELRKTIEPIRRLRAGPLDDFSPQASLMPKLLQSLIRQLAICRQVFDLGMKNVEFLSLADDRLTAMLKWFQSAAGLLAEAQPSSAQAAAALRAQAPHDWAVVPFERWREECRALEEQLGSIKDWTTLIKEWATHCRKENWRSAGNSQLGQMPGGGALTEGAKNYFFALERKSGNQQRDLMSWLGSARRKFEQAREEAGEGVIPEIASALRAMTFHHAAHQAFQAEAEATINQLSPQWNRLRQTLRHLRQNKHLQTADDGTLGLTDVSPHSMDIELEERIK